jgi:hypothetical protein
MADTTSPAPKADPDSPESWTLETRTNQQIAMHCGGFAYSEPGGWECYSCGRYIESRRIPGWRTTPVHPVPRQATPPPPGGDPWS